MASADTSSSTKPKRKRRRAQQACLFCRQRKLRCDGQRPCATCKSYGQSCEFQATLQKRSRGFGGDVQDTADTWANSTSLKDSTAAPATSSAIQSSGNSSNGARSASPVEEVRPESTYHGFTSSLFDDTQTSRRIRPKTFNAERVQNGLLAEAARQRQLETVNFNAGTLDFDGVDPDIGMHLLELHWNRQHHSFMITYRPAFMRDMACGGPYFSKLLLNAIYYGASKFSPRQGLRRDPDDVRTAGWVYRRRVKELLVNALDSSEITTIQALLVMTNSLFALGDERSAAWLYAGIAFRMITDLGMHVDAQSSRGSDMDLEIRRRVFWAAFVVDKIQSLYQGRPASLQEFEIRVPLSFNDSYEELEHWIPFAYSGGDSNYYGSPSFSISTFTELCKLCIIMNGILNKVYAEKSSNRKPADLLKTLEALDNDLGIWEQALPQHLRFNPRQSVAKVPPPHVMSLNAMYHVLKILLHRPFVEDGHLHTSKSSTLRESFIRCATAATEIVHLLRRYDEAFSISRAPYLISYATYVAATIHVRISAQRGRRSESHASLQTCLSVFQQNEGTNSAVKKARFVIENLARKMRVDIGQEVQTSATGSIERQSQNMAITPAASSPDLDIDAIIQSFMRDNGPQDESMLSYDLEAHRQLHPTHLVTAPPPSNIFTDVNESNISTSGTWNNSHGNAGIDSNVPAFDDNLFGFNGSPYDGFWYGNAQIQ